MGEEGSNLTLSINCRALFPKQRVVVKCGQEGFPSVKPPPGAALGGLTFYAIEKGRRNNGLHRRSMATTSITAGAVAWALLATSSTVGSPGSTVPITAAAQMWCTTALLTHGLAR